MTPVRTQPEATAVEKLGQGASLTAREAGPRLAARFGAKHASVVDLSQKRSTRAGYVVLANFLRADYDDGALAFKFAAAPELYEALANLLENPDFQTAVGGNPRRVDAMLARARAALKAARGE